MDNDQTPLEIVELNFAEGDLPEWVQLIPAGPGIRGIDGRVCAAFRSKAKGLLPPSDE